MLQDVGEETDKDPIINATFKSVVGERSGYCRGLRVAIKPMKGKPFIGLCELENEREKRQSLEMKLKEVETQLQEGHNMREEMATRLEESQRQLEERMESQFEERMERQIEERMAAIFLRMQTFSLVL